MRGIDDLIQRIQQAGKKVILVGPIARPDWDVASIISRDLAFGWPIRHQTALPFGQCEDMFGAAISHFQNECDITFVPVSKALCNANSCGYVLNGRSVYADDNHISASELWRF